jgi:hypothetical protein
MKVKPSKGGFSFFKSHSSTVDVSRLYSSWKYRVSYSASLVSKDGEFCRLDLLTGGKGVWEFDCGLWTQQYKDDNKRTKIQHNK